MGPEASELREQLEGMDRQNRQALAELPQRKAAEVSYHDQERAVRLDRDLSTEDDEALRANAKYYATVKASREYSRNWIAAHAPGNVVLDYACGEGADALCAAAAGAKLAIGLDISPVAVDLARREASSVSLAANSFFLVGDCERTGLPDRSVDVVICSGMLHHLDLSYAFPELRRILKPGGVCLAVEALNYNPAIKLYRHLTRNLRTDWERKHILSHKHLRFARWFFDVRNVRYWHFFSIMTTPCRRWRAFPSLLKVANAMDGAFLRIPPLSLLAWMFTFELHRRMDD